MENQVQGGWRVESLFWGPKKLLRQSQDLDMIWFKERSGKHDREDYGFM